MIRGSRTARRDTHLDPAEVLHLAEAAPASPRVDVGQLRDHVDQLAVLDAASGAWDVEALTALEHRLPREEEIDRTLVRMACEARQGLREVQVMGEHRLQQARHRTAGSDGVVRSQAALGAEVDRLQRAVEREEAKRERAGRVLRGEQNQHGVRWTGEEPPEPTETSRLALALRAPVLRHAAVTWGATAVASLIEGVICWDLMHGELRVDGGWRPLAFAMPLVLMLAGLPHLIGVEVATARRAERRRASTVTAAVLAAFWVGGLAVIAHERTTQIRAGALSRLAAQEAVTASQVPASLLGSFGWDLGFWLAVLLGIGLFLVGVKGHSYNPVVGHALRADTALAVLRPRLVRARAEQALVEGALAVQHLAARENEQAWQVFLDHTLSALREELLARYRNQLICALRSPDATTAVATTPTTAAGAVAAGPGAARLHVVDVSEAAAGGPEDRRGSTAGSAS